MYSFKVTDIGGKMVDLKKYQGKVSLVVNTASECGYTPQYDELQKLYSKYTDKGLMVLGFPSNDFGGQEPSENAEIAKFCDLRFKVKFPLFAKIKVKGTAKERVYDFLINNSPVDQGKEVSWNFEKFLVDRNGKVVGRFKSGVEPMSAELIQKIEAQLKL